MMKINKKSIIKTIKETSWIKAGKWQMPFLMSWLIAESTKKESFKETGFPVWFKKMLIVSGAVYFTKKDYDDFYNYFKSKTKKDSFNYLTKYKKLLMETGKEAIIFSELVKKSAINDRNKQIMIFNKFIQHQKHNMALAYSIIMIDSLLAKMLEGKIKEYVKSKNGQINATEILTKLTTPRNKSFLAKELLNFNRIVEKIKKDEKAIELFKKPQKHNITKTKYRGIYNNILKHRDYYGWMSSLCWHMPFYSPNHYFKLIASSLCDNEEIINQKEEDRKKEFVIRNIIKDAEKHGVNLKEEVKIIREMINAKMYNWDAVGICGNNFRSFFELVGVKHNLSFFEVLYLSADEINLLIKGKEINRKVIKRRINDYSIIRIDDNTTELINYNSNHLQPLIDVKIKETDIIKGQPTYLGIVRGIVCVVPSFLDVNKIKKRDILVCPMTNPDYIPAMHKASAFITDEGGILCHAAIVSREMKKPCIVGTKFATRLLHDGDLVEVDANLGVVKILKK